MEILNVLIAAVAGWMLGAVWYGVLSKPWIEASGVKCDETGKPEGGQSPAMFAMSFVLILVVAGMMRHVFELSSITTVGKGLISGFGIGLFWHNQSQSELLHSFFAYFLICCSNKLFKVSGNCFREGHQS